MWHTILVITSHFEPFSASRVKRAITHCDKPACLAHGNVLGADPITKGGTITYTCEPKFELVGSRTAICMGGYFSNPPPICRRNYCAEPTPIPYARPAIEPPRTIVGGSVAYICNPGYRPTKSMVRKCLKGNYWEPMVTPCVKT